MHASTILLSILLASTSLSENLLAVSEYDDGQLQAPTGLSAAASSSSKPVTSFTTMTTAFSVIASSPSISTSPHCPAADVTSHPPAVAYQPSAVASWNTTTLSAGKTSIPMTFPTQMSLASIVPSPSTGGGESSTAAALIPVNKGGAVANSVASRAGLVFMIVGGAVSLGLLLGYW